jgi:class 3 adenylate cyclase
MTTDRIADIEERINETATRDAVDRAAILSYILAAVFLMYGFTSFDFIHRFEGSATLWSNVWPRFIFNTIPFIGLALYLKRSTQKPANKLLVWIFGFSVTLDIAACVHVWPIALSKKPEILTYVHGANIFLFTVIYAGIAPPTRYLVRFTAILVGIFVLPLFFIAYYAGDLVILKLGVNDSTLALATGIFLSRTADILRKKIARLEIERADEASKFLGPVLSKAIFQNEKSRLQHIKCVGYVLSIDVRDSTELQKEHQAKWLEFRKAYFALAGKLVARHGGYLQKTVGDCHVINFGVMDYGADLSDIPGIEDELARAEERRLQRAAKQAFEFVDALFESFDELSRKYFPDKVIRLGAGIDKGWVERGIQGDGLHQELDVNGDPVNCSNRLQEYSKIAAHRFPFLGSVLVVSPYASDFLQEDQVGAYVRISTEENPVRNYVGIKWVLAKCVASGHASLERQIA